MKLEELVKKLNAKVSNDYCCETDITEFYAGDFLSRVMGKAPTNCGWLTIMNNINVAGVAVLADISVLILCEGVEPVSALKLKCDEEKITIITTPLGVFEACKAI